MSNIEINWNALQALIGVLSIIATMVGLWLVARELRFKAPALEAQRVESISRAAESNSNLWEDTAIELRLQIQQLRTGLSVSEEKRAEQRRESIEADIEARDESRQQAAKIAALESSNAQLQKDLDEEKAARRKLAERVTQLETENTALRTENTGLREENTQLKAKAPKAAARKTTGRKSRAKQPVAADIAAD